ncbi:hypothetical protein JTB14_020402 [Gonioctena quinquepunctata]|nr:hypothetical protein JTB14_020402 [Gonioctena quinquepunctata]
MSGYKRVSFYELCRLCASNTQKEKTHIFQEEGKKIQLQNKIQVCLALTVNENDFLPKVVCSKCLRTLETCFGFRQECVRSESMLSAYFKNFRYTEDFKRSGKVYIKDIKPPPALVIQQNPEISTSNIGSVSQVSAAPTGSHNMASASKNQQTVEQVPFYTLQLPTIVSNPNVRSQKELEDHKTPQLSQNQFAYNLNLINTTNIKTNLPKTEILSNVVVNSNGEVINIAHMGDFETILSQGSILKSKSKSNRHCRDGNTQDNVVHIDLTEDNSPMYELDDNDTKYNKLPHIKSTQTQNKYSYSLKVDDKNHNQTVIYPISEYNQNFSNLTPTNAIYTQSNLNIVNPTNSISGNTNVICTVPTSMDNSTLNMNVINPNLQDINQAAYTNVISTIPSSNNTVELEDPKVVVQVSVADNDNSSANVPAANSNTSSKVHSCEVCSRAFKRKEHLYQHVKLHTGFRPYVCEHCNKAFMRKEHLIRHSTLHSGQKNYTCNVCDKSFSRNDNLLKHKKTHEKQASYTCEICQKQFVMKHYYNAHKLTHGDKCYVSAVWGMLKT